MMMTSADYAALAATIARQEFGEGTRMATIFYQMMQLESANFSPDVVECRRVSSAGAEGIAQIMRVYHPGVEPCDPPAALRYAARYFRDQTAQYENPRAGAASYNAGPGRVANLMRQHGYDWERFLPSETKTYLRVVLEGVLWNGPIAAQDGLLLPFAGSVTQWFGYTDFSQTRPFPYGEESPGRGRPHTGIDVASVPEGTLVQCPLPGIVDWSGANPTLDRGYGLTVTVNIGGGAFLSFAHLAGFAVFPGNTVRAGDALGYCGSTGNSTGPHTHLELRTATGQAIDPSPYLLRRAPEPPQPPPDPLADAIRARWREVGAFLAARADDAAALAAALRAEGERVSREAG